MSVIFKFIRLPRASQRLLIQSACFLQMIQLGLLFFSFKKIQRVLTRLKKKKSIQKSRPSLDQIRWAVETASRYLPSAKSCLIQSLAAQALLIRYRYPQTFQIGVAKNKNGSLKAHAWVKSEGRFVTGEMTPFDFAALPHFGEQRT